MKALFVNDTEETLPEKNLSDWLKKVSKELLARKIMTKEQAEKELSLVFLKEIDAKQLNWNFRQRDYATDVLSFETEDPESIGELVFCPFVLQKQAKEHKVTYEHEISYMVLHGILHLLGFEHEKSEEAEEKMMRLQDEIFEALTAPPKKVKAPAPVKSVGKKVVKAAAPAKAKGKAKVAVKPKQKAKAAASAPKKKAKKK